MKTPAARKLDVGHLRLVVSSLNEFRMQAWSTSMLLLLHSAFMLRVVKMLLKWEFGGGALNSHGNYIVDHGKSWKNHGIVFLNFCGNPVQKKEAKLPSIQRVKRLVRCPSSVE